MGWKDKTEHGFTDSEGKDRPMVELYRDPNNEPLKDDSPKT
jgi:hypothetical protein